MCMKVLAPGLLADNYCFHDGNSSSFRENTHDNKPPFDPYGHGHGACLGRKLSSSPKGGH